MFSSPFNKATLFLKIIRLWQLEYSVISIKWSKQVGSLKTESDLKVFWRCKVYFGRKDWCQKTSLLVCYQKKEGEAWRFFFKKRINVFYPYFQIRNHTIRCAIHLLEFLPRFFLVLNSLTLFLMHQCIRNSSLFHFFDISMKHTIHVLFAIAHGHLSCPMLQMCKRYTGLPPHSLFMLGLKPYLSLLSIITSTCFPCFCQQPIPSVNGKYSFDVRDHLCGNSDSDL